MQGMAVQSAGGACSSGERESYAAAFNVAFDHFVRLSHQRSRSARGWRSRLMVRCHQKIFE